jgi:cobalt-zinc-cadmium efflux system outer membrane protein
MLDAAEARLDALKESGLREAEEAARVADVGYRNGKFSLVELIDAQEALSR